LCMSSTLSSPISTLTTRSLSSTSSPTILALPVNCP
jgi:hypothetical protein